MRLKTIVRTSGEPGAGQAHLRNIYDTRVVVRSAPSGTVYDFQPGQVLPVLGEDKNHLLALAKYQAGCCGGSGQIRKYFQED